MISVFFNCSSPFVGYRLLEADYTHREMKRCNASSMTEEGFKVFNISGSYMLQMDIGTKRYFHGRQFSSEIYDEQGRRIYANVAFLGENSDKKIIDRIATYALLESEKFYKIITDMITLTREGYEVDYDKLKEFIKSFDNAPQLDTRNMEYMKIYNSIESGEIQEKIKYIVLESDWAYFVKQAELPINDNSAHYKFTPESVSEMSENVTVTIESAVESSAKNSEETAEDSVKESVENPAIVKADEKTIEEETDSEENVNEARQDNINDEDKDKLIREKDRELGELRTELQNKCDEIKSYEARLKELTSKNKSLAEGIVRLEGRLSAGRLAAVLCGLGGIVITAIIAVIINIIFK